MHIPQLTFDKSTTVTKGMCLEQELPDLALRPLCRGYTDLGHITPHHPQALAFTHACKEVAADGPAL